MEKKNDAEGRAELKVALIDATLQETDEILAHTDGEVLETDVDPSGTPIAPGHPKICLGSGSFPGFEVCCDNCPHFLKCFPDAMPHAAK